MLRGIHKASSNWIGRIVMGVVLGLIAISFGIWGIGDMFRGYGLSTVATVGGTEIKIEQFRQIYMDRTQQLARQIGRPIQPDQARALGLDRQILSQLIGETVLDEQVRRLRLGISDEELARRVTDDPNFKGINGQFDRARFDQIVRQIGYNEQRYLAEQRRSALRQQLVGTMVSELKPSDAARDALNRYQNEQRSIEYVVLDGKQAGDIPPPSPDVLAKFFEARKVLFRAPEYRAVLLLTLTPEQVAKTIEVSDADIKRTYEDRQARYVTPERRHVQQMSFPNMDEARAASAKIAGGTSFAALAAERGLKDTDIDLGTVAKSAMVDQPLADAAFALKQGDVSPPVEGRFGVAIVTVLGIEPEKTQPLDQVAGDIKRDMATERARNQTADIRDKIEDERLGGATLAEIAKKFNLTTRTIEAVDRTGLTPDGTPVGDLPQGVDVLSSVFSTEIGSDNEPLTAGDGFVWYDVTAITPAHDRTLDEVKDKVEARWRDDEIAARIKTKSGEMLDKLKAGTPFNEVAAANGLSPQWLPGLKRNNPPPALPAPALDQVFRTAKDGVGAADGATPAQRIVFHLTEITEPTLAPDSADAKRIDELLTRTLSDDILGQYVAQLQKDIGVTVNQAGLDQVSGASSAN
jgi:peptidyl-prolyl cis-trans isomerase D